jgi:formylglycine-generating enzyme required for sulfatase activity
MRYLLVLCFLTFTLNGCLRTGDDLEMSIGTTGQDFVVDDSVSGSGNGSSSSSMSSSMSSSGDTAVENPITEITWITIPAGSFMMGSDENPNESPVHQVTVESFQMSETEVTVGQYRQCVEAGRCSEPDTGDYCTWGGSDDHPISCVDWGQARTFSVWMGGDLPTEAQWEYAARGGEDYEYAGSNVADEVAWFSENTSSTNVVKTKRANGYGLYDMSGNVWEWTLDEWHDDYREAPSRAEVPWGDVGECSQMCDSGSSRRVNRGGSWNDVAGLLRVAFRDYYYPGDRDGFLGFRVRRTLP